MIMESLVVGVSHDSKILGPVVMLDTVNVMDLLVRFK
jgi:hypothetical protein